MENNPTGAQLKAATGSLEDWQKRQQMLDKPWNEASVEEKLEKIKEELLQVRHLTDSVHNLGAQVNNLNEHTHVDGKVVVTINRFNGAGLVGAVMAQRKDPLR